jgi:hypothetical protein
MVGHAWSSLLSNSILQVQGVRSYLNGEESAYAPALGLGDRSCQVSLSS